MKSDTLGILVFPIGKIEVTTPRKCSFWFYICSLHDYWNWSTWNTIVHNSRGEIFRVKTCFSAPQNVMKENQLKHKNQVRNRFYWQL